MTEPITTRIPTDEQFAAAREIIRQEGGYVVGIGELLIEMGVEVTTEMAWVLNLTSELWAELALSNWRRSSVPTAAKPHQRDPASSDLFG